MSVCATTEVDEQSATTLDESDDDVEHIVGDIQYWLDRLGLKIPRSLCGILLIADPDRPNSTYLGAPTCPRCAGLAGWRS